MVILLEANLPHTVPNKGAPSIASAMGRLAGTFTLSSGGMAGARASPCVRYRILWFDLLTTLAQPNTIVKYLVEESAR